MQNGNCTDITLNKKSKRNLNELKQIRVKSTILRCDICKMVFQKESSLRNHRREHEFCGICKKYVSDEGHNAEHDQGNHACGLCGEHFLLESTLSDHLMKHEYLMGMGKCHVCGEECSDPEAFVKHLKRHSQSAVSKEGYECEEKECAVCEKRFLYFYRSKSLWQDGYICDVCTKSDYERLMDKANKSYTCMICDCTFLNKRFMKRHMVFHKMPKMEMEFKCVVCNAVLNNEYKFYIHKKSHENNDITRKKVHGRRNHSCGFCGEEFLLESTLSDHHVKKHKLNNEVDIHKKSLKKIETNVAVAKEEIECEEIIIMNLEETSQSLHNSEAINELEEQNEEDYYIKIGPEVSSESESEADDVNAATQIKQERLECEETIISINCDKIELEEADDIYIKQEVLDESECEEATLADVNTDLCIKQEILDETECEETIITNLEEA